MIHAGTGHSPRQLRVLRRAGTLGATTREIINRAGVCAVNSVVAELRSVGHEIRCTCEGTTDAGARVYRYTLLDTPAKGCDRAPCEYQQMVEPSRLEGFRRAPRADARTLVSGCCATAALGAKTA